MPPRRAAGSRVWPDARGLQALRRPVDEGEQHELRFIVIRQPQRVRNGRALLRQHRPLAALDERDLIRADGAASAGHEVSLGQVPGSSEEPQRFPTGLGSGKQLDGGQGHRRLLLRRGRRQKRPQPASRSWARSLQGEADHLKEISLNF